MEVFISCSLSALTSLWSCLSVSGLLATHYPPPVNVQMRTRWEKPLGLARLIEGGWRQMGVKAKKILVVRFIPLMTPSFLTSLALFLSLHDAADKSIHLMSYDQPPTHQHSSNALRTGSNRGIRWQRVDSQIVRMGRQPKFFNVHFIHIFDKKRGPRCEDKHRCKLVTTHWNSF